MKRPPVFAAGNSSRNKAQLNAEYSEPLIVNAYLRPTKHAGHTWTPALAQQLGLCWICPFRFAVALHGHRK